jgi:small subunit ribosomal protein S14
MATESKVVRFRKQLTKREAGMVQTNDGRKFIGQVLQPSPSGPVTVIDAQNRRTTLARDKVKSIDAVKMPPRERIRIRLRCKLCGRPRANYRKFGICRICFRNMASDGLIPGVKKASW